MEDIKLSDTSILNTLKKGGHKRMEVLKSLLLNVALKGLIAVKVESMGGGEEDINKLFEDALILLDKNCKRDTFKEEKSIKDFLLETSVANWLSQLSVDQKTRTKVMDHIAKDRILKDRVLYKMKRLSCKPGEGEDYYNQGFIRLNTVLTDGKYKGGDIKGFFLKICEHIRLNDLRKKKESFPEILPDKAISDTQKWIEKREKKNKMKEWLGKIGDKCKKTLQMWNDGFTMKEIAREVPYKDHLEAAVAKHRCLKKIYSLIDYRLWV